jgi:phospholipid/cholesterol/gamma-HCH transport system ATP-binding protein
MIEIKNVHKSFRGQAVLKGINLNIPTGKITVIIGPSGTGKTVLLRHIIGLIRPDKGQVIIDGTDIGKLGSKELNEFRRRFGMLFQNAALFDSLNVAENVAFPLVEKSRRKPMPSTDMDRIVLSKLKLVGLADAGNKLPSELSGGMRKRVGLARAIVLEPSIILYDEPTTGLDPIMTVAIDNLILSMQQELHVTAVVISHDIDSAFRVADQIAMIHDGRIIECNAPYEFRRSTNPVVREFLDVGRETGVKTGEGN